MTKAEIPKERMEHLLEKMGRAESAPRLRAEGGKKLFRVDSSSTG